MRKPVIPTNDQRLQAGKALREKCPRASHSKVVFGQGQKRDVVGLIEASNEDRVDHLVPIRHGRMLHSAFAYFRGTAAVQAYDLFRTPQSGIIVQACGDCHLLNFGGFATPERNLAFDINDFDETLAAPFEWDLKRLAASFVLASRWRGFTAAQEREIVLRSVSSYRESMRKRAKTGVLESWYSEITIDDMRRLAGHDPRVITRLNKLIARARRQTHEHVFHKITANVNGLPRIIDQPPLLFHTERSPATDRVISDFLKAYRDTLPRERRQLFDRFKVVDVATKVVGVGSVGTRCFVVLLLSTPDDPLFLQIKEARPSVLEPYVGGTPQAHNGERVVVGQRLMQAASDIFLGWSRGPAGRDFYIRQLRDMKFAADIETHTPAIMRGYAGLCGLTLARAHAKAGDAATLAGYLGSTDRFDRAIADYAAAYADQVERDYKTFAQAVRSGRLKSDLSASRLATALR